MDPVMHSGTSGRWLLIAVAVAAGFCCTAAGLRPYEFDWANRMADDRPVLLPLVSADGWSCRYVCSTGAVSTAREHVLFGDGVMRVRYRAVGGGRPALELRPSSPVPVPPGVDTFSVWIYGNMPYVQNPADPTPGVMVTPFSCLK